MKFKKTIRNHKANGLKFKDKKKNAYIVFSIYFHNEICQVSDVIPFNSTDDMKERDARVLKNCN